MFHNDDNRSTSAFLGLTPRSLPLQRPPGGGWKGAMMSCDIHTHAPA